MKVRYATVAVAALIIGVSTTAPIVRAETGDALLNKLVEKGYLTQREANEVRAQMGQEAKETMEAYNPTRLAKWLDYLKWDSDLRLRAEFFDFETNPVTHQQIGDDRLRYRVRLRLGLEAKFVDWATIGTRLVVGSDDPVSTNQSFENTFSRKPIQLDLAYATIEPPAWPWLKLTGGKMKNPIWQPSFNSPMHYDGDITPEGFAEQLSWKFGAKQQHALFANFAQLTLDEAGGGFSSGGLHDPYLFEFQAGVRAALTEKVKVTLAGGYYLTTNLEKVGVHSGSQPTGAAAPSFQSTSPNRGNATRQPGGAGTTLFYLDDFRVFNVRGEVAWQVREQPLMGTPFLLTLSGEYIKNTTGAYDTLVGSTQSVNRDQTRGYTFQIALGEARKKGQWQLAYQYKYLGADATWDAITDSDWGNGGTDRRGHAIKLAYNLQDWWQIGFTAFSTDKISNRPNSGENTRGYRGEDLMRFQLDTVFKF